MAAGRGRVVAVAGATNLLGTEILRVIESEAFPVAELRPLADAAELEPGTASDESAEAEREIGSRTVTFLEDEVPLRMAAPEAFDGCDIAFLAGSAEQAGRLARLSFPRTACTLDLSGRFAGDADVPLIVPEVNAKEIDSLPPRCLIAVPDAATTMAAVALAPLHAAFRVRRVIVSTYEAASGRGRAGMDELGRQIRDLFNYRAPSTEIFPKSLAFNCLPHVDDFEASGYTAGERLLSLGLPRLLGGGMSVTATRAWVPVFSGHSASLVVETERAFSRDEARAVLDEADGVRLDDDPEEAAYPVNGDTVGQDVVSVGRVRLVGEGSTGHGLALWIAADNVRSGGALSAVRLARTVLERRA